ncbi:MAG: oxidoreductase [Alteromonadaceae bacterium]|nr:oxidoreductase [Alteromonadaceae bacterium]|tara:strand:+ start:250 stop:1131 length:882 start_codon:yes stop_codon:yes gene_type:complete
MKAKIAFIGLGVMGYPMAGHLASAGYPVTVFNRTEARALKWRGQYSGEQFSTISEAVKHAEVVVTCVGDDNDLRQIYLGEHGVLANAPEGILLIDHTTASAEVAVEIGVAAAARSQSFLDAPVSGGEQGAKNGALTIMVGGEPTAFEQAQPLLQAYSRQAVLMGPQGKGQLTKMVNQIAVAGVVQGLAESLNFAQQAGLDADQVVEVISKGAAQSWQMENRSATMIAGEYNHGFAVDWMRKDLAICLAEARKMKTSLPMTALVDQFYADVQAIGGGRWDTSSLLERLRHFHKP